MNQLVNLPNISNAELPVRYVAAKTALTECSKIDECQDWADKAKALASYAKQADDESLRKMATRIQARAIRKCGELLKQIEPGTGKYQSKRGDAPPLDRKSAAEEAGLSDDQRKNALRVASVPEDEFEKMVDGENPPTITELAEMGKQRRTILDLGESTHDQFVAASQIIGMLNSVFSLLCLHKPEEVCAGMNKSEKEKIKKTIEGIGGWVNDFYKLL